MKKFQLISLISLTFLSHLVFAGTPVWTMTPLTSTTLTIPSNTTANIEYLITNQSQNPHTLVMAPIAGLTQITSAGYCSNPFTLSAQQTCILNLFVAGSTMPASITGGPKICDQGNPMQCYQASLDASLNLSKSGPLAATSLSTSISTLALSVSGLTEYGVAVPRISSGLPRVITITNTGSVVADDLFISYPSFPAGTAASSTCGISLAAGASCTITITPGATASSNGSTACTNGTAPNPATISVTAANASAVTSNVIILGYGCIYQGGNIYAFDDTPSNTISVSGKVVTSTDQVSPSSGIVWSSNGGSGNGSAGTDPTDVSYDLIPGIDQTSLSSNGSPSFSSFSSFLAATYTNSNPFTSSSFAQCNGNINGSCDSANILAFYNTFITNYSSTGTAPFTATTGPTSSAAYAAGFCTQTISGYSNWYLPAICELGYDTNSGSLCGTAMVPTLQNMQSDLVDTGLNLLSGNYWSATEYFTTPTTQAFAQTFGSNGTSSQNTNSKMNMLGVRCSRTF